MNLQKQLLNAVDNNNPVKLYGILRDGANPNVLDDYGTPLQKACIHPNYQVIKTLLDFGANPNLGAKGQSAFHTLTFYLEHSGKIHRQAEDLIHLFLEHGANIDLPNQRQETPFDTASPHIKEIINSVYNTWHNNGARTKKSTPKIKL